MPQAPMTQTATTIDDRTFARLSQAIVAGEIPPGSKISEPDLARLYGTSRGPLREHEQILDTVADGDEEMAEIPMRRHVRAPRLNAERQLSGDLIATQSTRGAP